MNWFNDDQLLIDELKRQVKSKDAYIKDLVANLERYETEARDAPIVINFDRMNIFSIERQYDNKCGSYTTIGFWVDDSKFEAWHLYCNDARHNQLIADYNEWRKPSKV